ncbi:MAG: NUDIX hydrolase [Candidatus Paceibacterota bacterium]
MLSLTKPVRFSPVFQSVGCFLEADGEILLLHRKKTIRPGNDTWCAPGGKAKKGENEWVAIIRELQEETGFEADPVQINFFKVVYVRYPEYEFVYHMFHLELEQKPKIIIDPREHTEYVWVTPQEALSMTLIMDEDICIHLFYHIK